MKRPTFQFISEIFPKWLRRHPLLQPWEDGRLRLKQEANGFIERFSPLYYDSSLQAMRERSALEKRLLSCWFYHWEKNDTGWSVEKSREHLLHSMEFQPLEEIVFSAAVYDRQNAAAVYFQKKIAPYLWKIGHRLLNVMHFADDGSDEWANDFWIFLLDEPEGRPCVILRYMGLVPIRNWLSLVFVNHVNNQWRKYKGRKKSVSLSSFTTLEGTTRTSKHEEENLGRLLDFMSQFLKKAYARLDAESQMRLEYIYLEGLSNREVAAILQENPSRTSRKRMALEERLVQELRNELKHSEEWREAEEFFSSCSASEVMRTILGGNP